jgi:hypothetical protein
VIYIQSSTDQLIPLVIKYRTAHIQAAQHLALQIRKHSGWNICDTSVCHTCCSQVGGSPVEEAKQPSIWKPDRINAIPHIFKTLSKTKKPAMSKTHNFFYEGQLQEYIIDFEIVTGF